MEINIRQAKPENLEELAKLVIRFREEHSRLIGGNKSVEYDQIEDEVQSHLQEETKGYFVAKVAQEEPIGYRSWELRDDYYFTKELFVHPDYRKAGVARKLIQQMEEWLVNQDQHSACISCVPQNVAMIELARSEGYKILNQIEMRKNLSGQSTEHNEKREALGYRWDVF